MSWFLNQKAGCFYYGKSYPAQKRLQVIVTYLNTLSTARTARLCRVSYNCVDKYVRFFQQRASLKSAVYTNARPKKVEWWMAAYLEALVRMYPTMYLRELQETLANDFNLAPGNIPSIASIVRLFERLRITRKKCIHVAIERMSPHNRYCRQLYFRRRRTINPSRIYFLDEKHILIVKQMKGNMREMILGRPARRFIIKAKQEREKCPY